MLDDIFDTTMILTTLPPSLLLTVVKKMILLLLLLLLLLFQLVLVYNDSMITKKINQNQLLDHPWTKGPIRL